MRYKMIMLVLIISQLLTSCSKEVMSRAPEVMGNTSANIQNRGLVAEQGDYIYGPMNYLLYEIKKDGTGLRKICDDYVQYVNVVGDWIYYSKYYFYDGTDNYGICKIKKDGTEKEVISNDMGSNLHVIDDWIYYTDLGYVYGKEAKVTNTKITIIKMKTDGSNRQIIVDENESGSFIDVDNIFIYNDWIYYISIENGSKLYKIKTDGTDKEAVSDQTFYSEDKGRSDFVISGDWIYYTGADDRKLYKMKIDGSSSTLVIDERVDCINITDDNIFYRSYDHYSLYKANTDGTNKVLLIEQSISNPNIAGGYVYCTTFNEYERLKVSINGGEVFNLPDN